jgi:hypothetical protein
MPVDQFLELIAKWRFFGIIESALWDMGKQISSPGDLSRSITLLLRINNWQTEKARRSNGRIMRELLSDGFISDFLKVNDYGGKPWFGKESAETAFFLMAMAGLMEILTDSKQTHKRKLGRMEKLAGQLLTFKDAADSSGYNLNHFLDILDQA